MLEEWDRQYPSYAIGWPWCRQPVTNSSRSDRQQSSYYVWQRTISLVSSDCACKSVSPSLSHSPYHNNLNNESGFVCIFTLYCNFNKIHKFCTSSRYYRDIFGIRELYVSVYVLTLIWMFLKCFASRSYLPENNSKLTTHSSDRPWKPIHCSRSRFQLYDFNIISVIICPTISILIGHLSLISGSDVKTNKMETWLIASKSSPTPIKGTALQIWNRLGKKPDNDPCVSFNASFPCGVTWRHRYVSPFVWVIDYCLSDTKSLHYPMPTDHQLDPEEHISTIYHS